MKTPKLDVVLGKCKIEDFQPASTTEQQPLYIDAYDEAIKCSWCPNWPGSQQTKVINQHVKKAASHIKAR